MGTDQRMGLRLGLQKDHTPERAGLQCNVLEDCV